MGLTILKLMKGFFSSLQANEKTIFTLLGLVVCLVSLLVLVYLVQSPQELRTQAISGPDLDVTFIEREPRYFRYCVEYQNDLPKLCTGTENKKRWPDPGEAITYTAHIINKGSTESGQFRYQWLLDGVGVADSVGPSLNAGQETTIQYQTTWPSSPQKIQFLLDPENNLLEVVETNNSLLVGSHDLAISIWVERGLYDIFNQTLNLSGSYSFEDWIEAQFAKMNERFSQAKYPVTQDGILDRVKIEKIVVAEDLDGPSSPMNSDPDLYLIDGRWQFTDNDPTNETGRNGAWQNYVNQFVNTIDWGLIHELAHQLGTIDLYRMNLANDPANNNRFQVTDLNGKIIEVGKLPPIFLHPGIMSGGETSPYNDQTYFESHTAGGMNSHFNFRRGYYGEYLFDTPAQNYLKIFDTLANPLSSAQVALYQKDPSTESVDNSPEITGTADSEGIVLLPNRSTPGVTTATGHTLKDNPFGKINVVGTNGTMFVKVISGTKESYHWLTVTELNLAYWSGAKDSATYTIKTNIDPRNIDPVNQALNKPASSNKEIIPGHEPAKAVDGDKTTAGNSWQTYGSLEPGDWWQVDLGATMDLGQVIIYPNSQNWGDWCDRFHIDVSTTGSFSGEQQTVVKETNSPHTQSILYIFPTTAGRYVRVINDQSQNWVQLQEFEVYAVSSSPTPTPTPTPTPPETPPPAPIPEGEGLLGTYYNNKNFTALALTRIDPTINFNWGESSPSPTIGSETFSIRWTGKVLPKYSEPYTFYTTTDDGVRLWVNEQLIIDRWKNQKVTELSGTISLVAGQKYNLKIEYYENTGNAVAELRWSSPSTPKKIVPQSQLFSN